MQPDATPPPLNADAPAGGAPAESAAALRRFLKVETQRLKIRHRFGLGGLETARRRSDLVDQVVLRAWRASATRARPFVRAELGIPGCAVVALGGYGRRELAPASDVDVLFLRHERTPTVKDFVRHVLHLLWDAGLTVGHSFRTVAECVDIARADLASRTAMAEARLVAGSAALMMELSRTLRALVTGPPRAAGNYVAALCREREERHRRFGGTIAVQEPHLKDSPGGLRDLHGVLWAAHARFGVGTLDEMRESGRLSFAEHRDLRRATDFVSRLRHEAHFSAGRRSDVLSLDLQPDVADALGYTARRGLAASETLMRDYYRHAEVLRRVSSGVLLRCAGPRETVRPRTPRRRGPFVARGGRLASASPDGAFHGGPRQMLRAFAAVQSDGLVLDDELALAFRAALPRVDSAFRKAHGSRALARLLEATGHVGPALRAMHETGVLGRLMPEIARVTHLVQHDSGHRYTVDEHTLRAVEALDEIARGARAEDAELRRLLGGIPHPERVYLALLLHDVGKGRGGSHAEKGALLAARACARLSLSPGAADDVVFLVRHHLLLSQVSRTRDLTDPRALDPVVHEVGTPERLDMLLLLTCADHRAVAPEVWNEWKAGLLWDLHRRVHLRLAGTPSPAMPSADALVEAAEALCAEFPRSAVARHFALLPARYLRSASPEEMARHFRLMQRLDGHTLVAQWCTRPERRCTELTVATPDGHGLLARLAGTLTAAGLDILSLRACTREDGIALDTFHLCVLPGREPLDPARWPRLEGRLGAAAAGRLDVDAAVDARRARLPPRRRPRAQPTVRVDATSSAACTVLEVRADDEPGLVHRIASTLAAAGLDVAFAAAATERGRALDVFYLTDGAGKDPDPERVRTAATALRAALVGRAGEPRRGATT